MEFTELRNQVEHIAAGIRQAGVDAHGPDPEMSLLGDALLVFGQVAVGIFEELHGIRQALTLEERSR